MSVHSRGVKPPLKSDADALTKAPAAPAYLSPEAKAEWKRIMPQLIERRIITKADLSGIENYCVATGRVREIETQFRTRPLDKVLFGMQNRAMQTARQLAAEYGLTPTSRTRIGNTTPEDEDDDNPLAVQ